MTHQHQTTESPTAAISRFKAISKWFETYMKPALDSALYFVGVWALGLFALSYFQIKFELDSIYPTIGLLLVSALAIPIVLYGLTPFFTPTNQPIRRLAGLAVVAAVAFGAATAGFMKASDEISSYRDAQLDEQMKTNLRSTDPSILVLSRLSKEVIPHLEAINGKLPESQKEMQSMRDDLEKLRADVQDIKDALKALKNQP